MNWRCISRARQYVYHTNRVRSAGISSARAALCTPYTQLSLRNAVGERRSRIYPHSAGGRRIIPKEGATRWPAHHTASLAIRPQTVCCFFSVAVEAVLLGREQRVLILPLVALTCGSPTMVLPQARGLLLPHPPAKLLPRATYLTPAVVGTRVRGERGESKKYNPACVRALRCLS